MTKALFSMTYGVSGYNARNSDYFNKDTADMKELIQDLKQEGMRLAALAAESERNGDLEVANLLWKDSTNYPCNQENTVWRYHRADYCEQQVQRSAYTEEIRGKKPTVDCEQLEGVANLIKEEEYEHNN